MFRLWLFFSFFQWAFFCHGQTYRLEQCMTEVLAAEQAGSLEVYYQKQPAISDTISAFRQNVTIPIVVHILWHQPEENISRQQVLSQIDALNADFSAKNDPIEFLSDAFGYLSEDSHIRFCLADSLSGIERKVTDYDSIGFAIDTAGHQVIYHKESGGLDAWDSNRYLNIWVGRMPSSVLGYYFTEFGNIRGIVIDPDVFGTIESVANRPKHALGKTLTHEIGHFLGLNHIWGFGCGIDDGIADTPPQKEPTYGCPNWPEWSCDTLDMYMNFMDYSDDQCLTMFTHDQISRMQNVLHSQYPLLFDTSCKLSAQKTRILAFPNPASNYLIVELPESNGINTISVFSGIGQKIFSTQVISPTYLNIPTAQWQSGIYYLLITNPIAQSTHRITIVHP